MITILSTATIGALALGFGGAAYVLSLSSLLSWEVRPVVMALGAIMVLLLSLGVYLRFTLLRK